MTKQPISRFPVPDLAALPVDLQNFFKKYLKKQDLFLTFFGRWRIGRENCVLFGLTTRH